MIDGVPGNSRGTTALALRREVQTSTARFRFPSIQIFSFSEHIFRGLNRYSSVVGPNGHFPIITAQQGTFSHEQLISKDSSEIFLIKMPAIYAGRKIGVISSDNGHLFLFFDLETKKIAALVNKTVFREPLQILYLEQYAANEIKMFNVSLVKDEVSGDQYISLRIYLSTNRNAPLCKKDFPPNIKRYLSGDNFGFGPSCFLHLEVSLSGEIQIINLHIEAGNGESKVFHIKEFPFSFPPVNAPDPTI